MGTAKTKKLKIFEAPLFYGLYYLTSESTDMNSKPEHILAAYQSGSTTEIPLPIDEISRVPENDAELWHFRPAYASCKTISRLPKIPKRPNTTSRMENACKACLAGKTKELSS